MKVLILNILLISMSCNQTKTVVQTNTNQELRGNFMVTSINQQAVNGKQPTLSFNDKTKTVSGNAGCNSYGGNYTLEGETLTFGLFRKTEMYCDEPVMQIEKSFFTALSQTHRFSLDSKNKVLLFYDKDNNIVLEAKNMFE